MIQFALPIALLTAVGILVPVLLHLWRPPARTVRLGSLRFLETVPGRRLRDLRWRDRLLLLIRMSLLLALTALLAQPFWHDQSEGSQRWALLAPNAVLNQSSQQAWRRLLAEGYQPRRLASGFPDVDAPASPETPDAIDAWSLLREADARVPAGSKFVVFAPPRAALLRGTRPSLGHSEVRWIATAAVDDASPATWIDPLSVIPYGRGLRATIGTSNATSTRFSTVAVTDASRVETVSDPLTHAELNIRRVADDVAVRLSGTKPGNWIPLSIERPIRVAIVHGPDRAEDARYVAAAVRAVSQVSARPITVEVREENVTTVLPEADWVFRLGASPLTASMSSVLAEDRVNVVTDAARDAKVEARPSWFATPQDPMGVSDVRLWRRTTAGPEVGVTIWTDGFGSPLLAFAREGRAQRWRFFSRFHPEWNDWVTGGAFPAWLRALLLGEAQDALPPARDRRLVDLAQTLPARAATAEAVPTLPPAAGRSVDLEAWLWIFAAVLLALERGLSLRNAAARSAAPPAPAKSDPLVAEVAR